jgi:hypothetical protein
MFSDDLIVSNKIFCSGCRLHCGLVGRSCFFLEWVALVLLPAVSSIPECGKAIGVSVKDQVTLSISVAVGSSIVGLISST